MVEPITFVSAILIIFLLFKIIHLERNFEQQIQSIQFLLTRTEIRASNQEQNQDKHLTQIKRTRNSSNSTTSKPSTDLTLSIPSKHKAQSSILKSSDPFTYRTNQLYQHIKLKEPLPESYSPEKITRSRSLVRIQSTSDKTSKFEKYNSELASELYNPRLMATSFLTNNSPNCNTNMSNSASPSDKSALPVAIRPIEFLREALAKRAVKELDDEEVLVLLESENLPHYSLESLLKPDYERAVRIRRRFILSKCRTSGNSEADITCASRLPISSFDYASLTGTCCECVIGYVTLPVGVAGPLVLDGREYFVPLATTEGALVASTNRGCRAISLSAIELNERADEKSSGKISPGVTPLDPCCGQGVRSFLLSDGMTRGPLVRMPNAERAFELRKWIISPANWPRIKGAFELDSKHTSLERLQTWQLGRLLFLRFSARTGDAMGMNMVTRGTERVLQFLKEVRANRSPKARSTKVPSLALDWSETNWSSDPIAQENEDEVEGEFLFGDMIIETLSGNVCVDKKNAAINWIEGRGKSITCEAIITRHVVENVLKTSVPDIVQVARDKNLVGSSISGCFGGNNAHAANIVAAVFAACGQDLAQVTTSAGCITLLEPVDPENPTDSDLCISCSMPCLEVATVGGGTRLSSQRSSLGLLGLTTQPNHANPVNSSTKLIPNGSLPNGHTPNHSHVGPDSDLEHTGPVSQNGFHENPSASDRVEPSEGHNSAQLARIVCATVLASELSLLAALSAGHLVCAHSRLNGSRVRTASASAPHPSTPTSPTKTTPVANGHI